MSSARLCQRGREGRGELHAMIFFFLLPLPPLPRDVLSSASSFPPPSNLTVSSPQHASEISSCVDSLGSQPDAVLPSVAPTRRTEKKKKSKRGEHGGRLGRSVMEAKGFSTSKKEDECIAVLQSIAVAHETAEWLTDCEQKEGRGQQAVGWSEEKKKKKHNSAGEGTITVLSFKHYFIVCCTGNSGECHWVNTATWNPVFSC